MRVILIPFGSAGDVYPFVALGTELQRRGYRVMMITSAYFGDLARRAGFEFEQSLSTEDYLSLIGNPHFWHPLRSMHLLVTRSVNPGISVIYNLLKKYHRPGENAVVAGTLALGARVAQEKLEIPLTTVHLQPAAIRSCYTPSVYPGLGIVDYLPTSWRAAVYRLVDAAADRIYAGPLNAFRRHLGLPRIKGLFGQWWHSPESTLALFPSWYAAPQPDWPANTHVCGFPLYDAGNLEQIDSDLETYLADGDPPIVFTSGSARTSGREFFAASAAACELLGRRALFVTRFARQLPRPLPALIRHVQYEPFSRLLPRAAALVHHGGIGTAAQALRAGVPQLVVPGCYDQFDNAARLRRLGVSRTLSNGNYSPANVAGALRGLLEEREVHMRCAATAARFDDRDTLRPAVDALEQYWRSRYAN
jgi:rhamnosyltransferase subunit B